MISYTHIPRPNLLKIVVISANLGFNDSGNGLVPNLHQAITRINAGQLSIRPLPLRLYMVHYQTSHVTSGVHEILGWKPGQARGWFQVILEKICKRLLTHWSQDNMDEISQTIFLNAFSWIKIYDIWISIDISQKLFPKGPNHNIPALIQIMAWPRPGDKPLSERMMVKLPTNMCITQPQWVNACHELGIN